MAIYRGPGGAGDATADAASEASLIVTLTEEAQDNADAAAASAAAASTSATNAAASASTATTQATNASTSATTATTQASNASTSASSASTSATNAAASAATATTQATNASTSATTATTQASNASTSATAAASSATAAASSATSASGSASTATTQAGIATTQATNAATSATNAAASAVTAAGYVVPSQTGNSGKYLKTDGTATSWDALDISTADVTGTLPVSKGGTGVTTSTGTGNTVLSASPTFTGNVSFGAGTAALPAITTTGDTNTGVFFPAADTIAFAEGGAEAMRLSSSGYLGINTTSPTSFLNIEMEGVSNGIFVGDTLSSGVGTQYCVPMIQTLGSRTSVNNTFSGRFGAAHRRMDGVGITANTQLGTYAFGGQWGTSASYVSANLLYTASIQGIAEGTFSSASAMPTAITFKTGSDGDALGAVNTSYGTERMRLTSTGLLGLGSTAPIAKLEVAGNNNNTWTVTASISGTTMDVTAVTTGTIAVGDLVYGANIQPYTRVTALGTGTGGIGTYTVSVSQTSASATVLGSTTYSSTVIRITETDTTAQIGQPTGALQFFSSDASSPTAGVGAYVAAISEDATPDTSLIFGTRDDAGGGVDANERMRLTSSGDVLIGKTSATANGGDLQVSSGITFPATQVAKSDANTLDDYEEGTWTPTSTTGSYTSASGTYTKTGRVVVLNFSVTFPASGMSGNARLNSIPFNVGQTGSDGTTTTYGSVIRTVYDTVTPTVIRLATSSGTSIVETTLYSQTVSGTLTYFV
jgi:hypothetical protein